MKAPKKLTKQEQEARGNLRSKWLAPNKEWLEYHYTTLGKSAYQIAGDVGAGESGEIVRRWLEEEGLEVRKYYHESPDAEQLKSLYIEADLTMAEIAYEYGVDPGTVLSWLITAEIPRRPISHRPGRGRSVSAAKRYLLASKVPLKCIWCGVGEQFHLGHKGVLQLHHRDHDRENNAQENLCWMCYTCHQLESRLWHAEKEGKISFELVGDRQLLVTFRKLNL